MEQYEALAKAYDALMYDVAYDEWAGYIVRLLEARGIKDGVLLEYACGTGNLTVPLLRAGYEVLALDVSEAMLDVARKKLSACALQPQLICEDMAAFRLNKQARAAVCACDGVNYLLTDRELEDFFANAYENIAGCGVFLFDISSAYKLEEKLGDQFFYDDGDGQTVFWQNSFDKKNKRIDMDITLFMAGGDVYHRCDERHMQRAWEEEEITNALTKAGFAEIKVMAFMTQESPERDIERLQFAAQKRS